jgi:N-acetyl-alpha-D-muramate 1-phosphate uridylyltransferase
MKAMLFAAGLGTRLKPFTENHPKALAPVNGKPLLQRNIEFLKSFGITEIVVNVFHFADQIIDFLASNNNFGITIHISDERPEVLETGGGLVNAKDYFDDDFLVMNVDILTDLNLSAFIKAHQENNALVTLAVSDRNSSRKLLFTEDMKLKGWRNLNTNEEILANESSKGLTEFAFSGIHIINPNLFNHIKDTGKFSIMKVYMELMKTETIIGFNHSGGILIDVGRPSSVVEAETIFK